MHTGTSRAWELELLRTLTVAGSKTPDAAIRTTLHSALRGLGHQAAGQLRSIIDELILNSAIYQKAGIVAHIEGRMAADPAMLSCFRDPTRDNDVAQADLIANAVADAVIEYRRALDSDSPSSTSFDFTSLVAYVESLPRTTAAHVGISV